jgi:hypothetical protein
MDDRVALAFTPFEGRQAQQLGPVEVSRCS